MGLTGRLPLLLLLLPPGVEGLGVRDRIVEVNEPMHAHAPDREL